MPAWLTTWYWAVGAVALVAGLVLRAVGAPRAHRRGALLRGRRVWSVLAGSWSVVPPLRLAGVPIPIGDECKHFKLIGSTGSGKSTAIRELLATALERGDRAIVSDPDGAYQQVFARRYRGDCLLNPFEPESLQWNPFGELWEDYDVEQLASALVAGSADPAAQEWRGYARTFMSAVLRYCWRSHPDIAELWRLLAVAGVEELRPLLAGSPAQPFLDVDNARMFGSIRAVTVAAVSPLEHVLSQRAAPLAVRRWVERGRGVLWLPYRAGQIAALRTMISTWLRLAIFQVMHGVPHHDQRLWLIVDELDALGAIDGLKDALARLRKFGGRCVLGFQSIAQVSGTYGHAEAQTLVENCSTTLILRCAGGENGGTSQFASRLIGEREVVRLQRTRSRDRSAPWSRSTRSLQLAEQRITEHAVLASEIEQLPDLAGFLKTASAPQWWRVRLDAAGWR